MKPEQSEGWPERQRSYYDRFEHRYLAPSAGGRYAENITAKLWSMLGSDPSSRGLELGCGAGRFTLPLLARCRWLDAVDLSETRLGCCVPAVGSASSIQRSPRAARKA